MMHLRFFLTILFAFAFLHCAFVTELHAAVTMRAEIDRSSINMDESVRLFVTMEFSRQNIRYGQLRFPEQADFELEGTQFQEQISVLNGVLSIKRTTVFILMPTRSGQLSIPPLQNWYIDPDSSARVELETPPLTVNVTETRPTESSNRPREHEVKPVIEPQDPLRFTLKVLAASVAAIIVTTLLFIWWYHRREDNPRELALFDLKLESNSPAETIRQQKRAENRNDDPHRLGRERLLLLARDDERSFSRELGSLLRSILEKSSGQSFLSRTADEIREQLEYLRLNGEARNLIEEILEYTDAVNYLGGNHSIAEREALIEKLRRLSQINN